LPLHYLRLERIQRLARDAAVTIAIAALLTAPVSAATIRPPAVPLVVRGPYESIWLPSTVLNGASPMFWNGRTLRFAGEVSVDGTRYVFMGLPRAGERRLPQTAFALTPTRSIFTLRGAGVELSIDFLSPVEASDVRRLAMPFGYLFATARSVDGRTHRVRLNVSFDSQFHQAASTTNGLSVVTIAPQPQQVLAEHDDMPAWGTQVLAARSGRRLRVVATPAGGYAFEDEFGTVGPTQTAPFIVLVGYVREPAVSYLGKPLPPLWKSFWPTWQRMAAFAAGDAREALSRAEQLDARVTADAMRAGGPKYAALCALAMRQAFGAVELVGTAQRPWLFLKEISSDGNVSTVDVIYPAFPVFLYANPQLLGLLLDPLFAYAQTGGWPKPYAEHDLGSSYPNAAGHNDGKEEDMPVEESANMLLMTDAYAQRVDAASAREYVRRYYRVLSQWADYEIRHGVDPENQLTTDDFTGRIRASANLALKAVLSVAAMAQLAHTAGYPADAKRYRTIASGLMGRWLRLARSTAGPHLVLAYGQPSSWSLKYNAFPDRLLDLAELPAPVLSEESSYYLTRLNRFGVPLDNRHSYTKLDWEMFVAAATQNARLRTALIDDVYDFANASQSRTPLSDWYDTVTGQRESFTARPVVGAVFSLLVNNRR
jgi:hypothetical protein